MNSVFNEQILADKLSKLNSTQQCIETMSHWCIFHQSKAELVVATWEKQFHSSEKANKIPFLYLANDILQNSKRKGNEFVSEFWKVLPSAIKDVLENGDDQGKNLASRLVDIWEQRRVFGSRAKGLKDLMLGKESLPPLELNKKRSRSVRILKRDSRSVRIKLSTGGTAEKIVSAFHSVLSEHPDEDLIMSTCKSAVHHVRKMEKDVNVACTKLGDPKRTTLANELEEEETVLKETIEKLKLVETTRTALVAQLREALREQESELENVRTQLQVAQSQTEEARYMRKRLNNETDISVPNPSTPQVDPNSKAGETSKKSAAAIAAAVADRLTASTSSQQIMTSVLSSFAAEAVKNAGLATTSTPSNSVTSMPTNSFPESRPKQEKPVTVLDQNVYMTTPQPYQTVLMHQQIPNSQQPQYHLIRNPPPQQQYLHPPQGGIITYGYSTPTPPHPQPPPPQQMMNLTQPQYTTHPPTMIHQPPAPPSFRPLQPPGMMYYTYPHQPPQ